MLAAALVMVIAAVAMTRVQHFENAN